MVRLNRIYTRTGDDGTTGLTGGERRRKDDLRIEAVGAVDEANAVLGLARLHAAGDIDAALARVQNDLFDLGADLSTPGGAEPQPFEALRVVEAQVERLEREIDAFNAALAPLRSFVLPGGSPAAAALHVARTVCRRAERVAVALAAREPGQVSPVALRYLNRLSDLLFVLARAANDNGALDVLWRPGANR
ncbi:cob(I)yrinic acid a,c-diamide adenosyltransferase [Pseudochelatococcus lubricantis]|nr:cob(I)yrinic acid a,c-diamide adenosyltransferase [Pseudochelatococcus lubricantis]